MRLCCGPLECWSSLICTVRILKVWMQPPQDTQTLKGSVGTKTMLQSAWIHGVHAILLRRINMQAALNQRHSGQVEHHSTHTRTYDVTLVDLLGRHWWGELIFSHRESNMVWKGQLASPDTHVRNSIISRIHMCEKSQVLKGSACAVHIQVLQEHVQELLTYPQVL